MTNRKMKDSAAPESVDVATTSFGKTISIARCRNGRMFQINVAGGGVKPPALCGLFTNYDFAQDAVRGYLAEKGGKTEEVGHRKKLTLPKSTLTQVSEAPAEE